LLPDIARKITFERGLSSLKVRRSTFFLFLDRNDCCPDKIWLYVEKVDQICMGMMSILDLGLTDRWISDIVALADKSLKAKTRLSVLVK
jgi:hypothetical protein